MPEPRHDPAAAAIRLALGVRRQGGFTVTCGVSRAALDYAEAMADRDEALRIAMTVFALWQCRARINGPVAALDGGDDAKEDTQ